MRKSCLVGKAKLRLFIYNHASSCECVDDVNTFIETLLLYAIFIIRYIELLLTYIKRGTMYGILCTYIRKMILTFFQRWILYSFSMYLQWKRIWNRRTKGACKDRWWKVCRYHSRCQNRTKWATQSRRYWSNKASFRRNFVRVNGSTSRCPNSSFNNKIKCWWSRGVLRIKASQGRRAQRLTILGLLAQSWSRFSCKYFRRSKCKNV